MLPSLLAARPVGDSRYLLASHPLPPAHAADVRGGEGHLHWSGSAAGARAARLSVLNGLIRPPAAASAPAVWAASGDPVAPGVQSTAGGADGVVLAQAAASPPVAAQVVGGFTVVGNVAVIEADVTMADQGPAGFHIRPPNLAALAKKFIAAFGDQYDQIAVFLGFIDRESPMALAYQQPIKNDVKGLGLSLFDSSDKFGSPSGKLQTMLNMKRINVYGRFAANDPDNGLYAVWAQEAGHRWLVYFKYQREGDAAPSDALLGRQKAHWAANVQAEGSIQDGYTWRDNGDGTFTPVDRGVRYGPLDQYGMGLRTADEVPPFFILRNIVDENGTPVTRGFSRTGRYRAEKIDLTVQDIIRAEGARVPATDAAAQDLRMGVVLLGAPGQTAQSLIGEGFAIDNTRRLWTDFYNEAGGGRGRVCTELLHPCRGAAFEFGPPRAVPVAPNPATHTVGPGDELTLEIDVTNVGNEPGPARVQIAPDPRLQVSPSRVDTAALAPGQKTTVKFRARATLVASCAESIVLDVSAPGARGLSRAFLPLTLGLQPGQIESFDGAAAPAGWQVDPDGSDSGVTGRWALGAPQRTQAFDYTLQPGAAYSGAGVYGTGLSGEQTDNVEGKTTLSSAPFDLRALREPHLSYQLYFVAADFAQEVLVPAQAGSLVVQGSIDGGSTWTEVDRVIGMGTGWQRRLSRLSQRFGPALASAQDLRLRFVVEEVGSLARPVVEAIIDDVGVYSEAATCAAGAQPSDPTAFPPPGSGDGGCRYGGGPGPGGGWPAVGLLGLVTVMAARLARRRRRG